MYKDLVTIYDLEKVIEDKVKNASSVLAIGETDMDFDISYKDKLDDWRFKKLHGLNNNIIGLDYNKENVKSAHTLTGLDVRYGDVQDWKTLQENLGDMKFDFIIMMDVVEHLSNIGSGLKNLKALLKDGGELLVTVPNPWYFQTFISLLLGKEPHIMQDHTNFTCPSNMKQLVKREGLTLKYYSGIHFLPKHLKLLKIQKLVLRFIKWYNHLFLNHYLYIITK